MRINSEFKVILIHCSLTFAYETGLTLHSLWHFKVGFFQCRKFWWIIQLLWAIPSITFKNARESARRLDIGVIRDYSLMMLLPSPFFPTKRDVNENKIDFFAKFIIDQVTIIIEENLNLSLKSLYQTLISNRF